METRSGHLYGLHRRRRRRRLCIGQEAVQYFVAFGNKGLWGVVLAAALMIITGVSILQLGSYFQADEHTAVYDRITGPIVSRILDWGTLATLFSIGFVMFAGGGSTISQQFEGVPIWVGGAVMLVLVLLVGLLDVDKVSSVIGAITPFIIFFVVLATGYTIIVTDVDWSWANDYAINNVESPLNNWWLAALNYTGLNVMCAVSMSIVIGGNILDNRAVGIGGLIGGFFYLLLLALLVVSLYMVAPDVHEQDLPVLSLINNVNPILGYFMTFIIYGMVFNTAIGMFYAMGKRLTRKKPKLFYPVYAGACVVGFILSFIGFKQLVSSVYPILGWIGLLMIAVMVITWITQRDKITSESDRRVRARTLVKRRLDPREHFTKKNERELRKLAAASNMETEEFVSTVADEIHEELEADDEIEYDREDPDPSVTFVEHTKPEVPKD